MDELEIQRIEAALGTRLPIAYRRTLLADPLAAFRDDMRPELMSDASDIIALNLGLRAQGFFGLDWSEDMLAIGMDGGGGVLYLRLTDPELRVFLAAHDGGPVEGEVEHPSFREWVEELRRDIAEATTPRKGLPASLRDWWAKRRR